ncbi:MAG: HDOD domain-containing protein [Pirellulales bacterium]|nr:HDOD domain-containing protein [Pirellulales bacterium]
MRSVLFVDDDPKLLAGLRRMLRGLRGGWNLEFIADGAQALQRISFQRFDVVVADLRMPGMDGAELLEEVRVRSPQTVRIMLSGQCDRENLIQAVRPAHQFLMKPCDSDTLQGTIVRAFQLRDRVPDKNLRQWVLQITSLPTVPAVYQELCAAADAQQASIERLSRLVSQDVGAAAKVLQLVSSGFFGPPQKVLSPRRAAALLGLETMQALVRSPHVFRPAPAGGLATVCKAVAEHSLETARIARTIAKVESGNENVATQAYVAGLLHDVGDLVFMDHLWEPFLPAESFLQEILDGTWDDRPRPQTIRHTLLGGYLLGLWGLPDVVIDSAVFHHEPSLSADTEFTPLTAVHVADALAREKTASEFPEDSTIDAEYLERVGCSHRLEVWKELCSTEEPAAVPL